MIDSHIHIGSLNQLFSEETQPFRKVHRMIDLFESIIKSHSVVILSEYVKHNRLSESAKGMLASGLRTPSLGTWQLLSRVLFEELKEQAYDWSFDGFSGDFTALDKALNVEKTNVIALRNGYAHGATPTDGQCKADILKFEPFLEKLLNSKWLINTNTEVRDGKVWIATQSNALCAHPILVHKAEDVGAPYAFFNDLKNDKVGLLNYPLSKHYREKDFYREFHEYLPLHEWKKTGSSDFTQRIEELTETFKGRLAERSQIHDFILTKSKGYLSIQGNPGIGKSALIAQVFKEIKSSKEAHQLNCIEYFIRRGTQQADVDYLLNYLVKRTDEVFPQGREIRAEGKMTFDLQNQLFSKWRLWLEHSQGKKLLFLIDGLDEGVEKNLLAYMPRENFENILIIYGSRPGGHKSIDELWATLPPEHHTPLLLEGLSMADIRALIYDVANKYELERESVWIDVVQQRSQGNPLYLRLLCNAIENGSIALNDLNALPQEIDEYYKAILSRYAQDMVDGDALLAGLFTFAAAKDYLTMAHLGLINRLGDATIQRIGSTLKEVLFENPLTEDVLDYQLFHESFREYLVKEKAKQVNDAAERILDYCASWESVEGTWEQRYALEHYASHLSESKKEVRAKELWGLLKNSRYKETQKNVLKQYDASRDLARIGLLKASELKQFDLQLECALQLVDLKYEEANDATQVVALVADGEIDLALKRIESFGGSDQEGVKRRFILYMLCLMELTLLESKTKPYRKTSVAKILQHLDEQIPVDHSNLNWNDFFPSYVMFLMACELAKLDLVYLLVYKRTENWKSDWLGENGPYNDLQLEVLQACARGISSDFLMSSALADLSAALVEQGNLEEALACARGINSDTDMSSELAMQISDKFLSPSLAAVSAALVKQGNVEEAHSCLRGISSNFYKISALLDISAALAQQGNLEEAASSIREALTCARGVRNDLWKSSALASISAALAQQGNIEEAASSMQEALDCARGISSDFRKSSALADLSAVLSNQGDLEEATSLMQEALACARGISSDFYKISALLDISAALTQQGNIEEATSLMQEALACARGISSDTGKIRALLDISAALAQQGNVVEAASSMQEALACARGIISDFYKGRALLDISAAMVEQGNLEEALACARGISSDFYKGRALLNISATFAKQGNIEETASSMQASLACAIGMSDLWKINALASISAAQTKQGKIVEALACVRGISSDNIYKSSALASISAELAKQGKIEEALDCARGISSYTYKNSALLDISAALAQQGNVEEATSLMQEALACARGISSDTGKIRALLDISAALAQQGNVEEAASSMQEVLACARGISSDTDKSLALLDISAALAQQGNVEEAASSIHEALDCARGISSYHAILDISAALAQQGNVEEAASSIQDALARARGISSDTDKSRALASISVALAQQGNVEEAHACARGISSDFRKSRALASISAALAQQGKIEEALACARGINSDTDKSRALASISAEFAKQGRAEEVEAIVTEIPQIGIRHSCWEKIAVVTLAKDTWEMALNAVQEYKTDEARLFCLRGWCEKVDITAVSSECIIEILPLIAFDSYSIEALLRKYAVRETLLCKPKYLLQQRLNATLNIQWAIDIAAQFPNLETKVRLSTNLEAWLHEIVDEDDRDQIELWAKQVAKGKITEEEFGQRVSEI